MTPRKTSSTPAKRGVKPPTRAKANVRTGPKEPPRSARRPARKSADTTPRAEDSRPARQAPSSNARRPSKRPDKPKAKVPARKAAAPQRAIGTPPDIELQLLTIENRGGDGDLELGKGRTLHVSSLDKVFFPEARITKGAVMRYYTRMSRFILPDIDGRPLVLKRYPDGIEGQMFFQQDAGAHVPDVVRVAAVETLDKGQQSRIIGGDLPTLLYTVQLGAIEVHPWFSRIDSLEWPDRALIDLDPGEGVLFPTVVELAQDIVKIARECHLPVAVKTSGSRGIHLVFPLPARTSYDSSAQLAMLIARAATVARPDVATVERSVSARPEKSIYVDAMQNAQGKSMAGAYSIRAKPIAPVSAPLRPRELTPRLRLASFTMATMPARAERTGDIWREALAARPTAGALARAMQMLESTLAGEPSRGGQKRG
jgi:bifunctional non-homologous end joining protein LigD